VFQLLRGIIRNNLIAHNTGGRISAGSGLWILGTIPRRRPDCDHNTIIYKSFGRPGGESGHGATNMTVINNILWKYRHLQQPDYFQGGAQSLPHTNDIEDGYSGSGNINIDPEFDASNYFFQGLRPVIRTRDSTAGYNDLPDPLISISQTSPPKEA